MTRRVLRARDRAALPWKNGGGITREIAAGPEGPDGFDWRVSLAEVDADGPFSVFPGVDRTLTLVEGAGMDLTIGRTSRPVGERWVPQDFPGDVPTHCRLIAGPVVNLNVMCRRGSGVAAVTVVRGPVPVSAPEGTAVLAVALEGRVVLGGTVLRRYDAVLLTPGRAKGAGAPILGGEGRTAVITLRHRPR
jgi:environmental stress-induced protein Ves